MLFHTPIPFVHPSSPSIITLNENKKDLQRLRIIQQDLQLSVKGRSDATGGARTLCGATNFSHPGHDIAEHGRLMRVSDATASVCALGNALFNAQPTWSTVVMHSRNSRGQDAVTSPIAQSAGKSTWPAFHALHDSSPSARKLVAGTWTSRTDQYPVHE